MAPRLGAVTDKFTGTKKVGVISALSCCGCGGLAFLLLMTLGVIGVFVAPTTPTTPGDDPTVVAQSADREAQASQEAAPSASESATPTETPSASTTPDASTAANTTTAQSTSPSASATPDASTALGMLETLEVKGRAPKTGYDRDLFGWRDDVDHNGCDTRNDVLRRDLSDVVLKHGTDGCVVLSGTLSPSPYSGDDVAFDQQDDNSLDIDHLVALSDAWQTGASGWDEETRHAFANDPLNLVAVESGLNRKKGDGDAATWLPPRKAYRCEYVARQIAVKAEYDLWVKPAEKDAMRAVLEGCEDTPAFAGAVATPDRWEGDNAREAPAPTKKPATSSKSSGSSSKESSSSKKPSSSKKSSSKKPSSSTSSKSSSGSSKTSSSSSGSGSTYYKNCDAVRAAGKDPIYAGEPGYSRKLDRDGDGVGCE
ncbi:DUF1524 domain-containing protein [Brachybacterium halotolerans subsp. kimchii]|uniref:GmrSD restriction endonuclease domain-containing protein n=1 Tax=Brachybacterium halotolerans TaxID=2795215 RepID=UPI001E33C66B|nr:DUF1524 domain-containing protein [Brachybacterium halotolerans]UEJ81817.1 DUF1524 domain-containing protein [Brachybacterium halotolerans subsp. kimchii]